MGDRLIVAVSTDDFNEKKGKKTVVPYADRSEIVKAIRFVDRVIPERSWEQKIDDIKKYGVSVFAIGDDWAGKFDHLKEYCEVFYLPRTEGISSTDMKRLLQILDQSHIKDLKLALDLISSIVERFQ